jgi:hypothetical protein
VDAVVRGVQRRSGDAEEPTRDSGTELVAVLDRVSPAVPPVESDGETTPGESR